MYLKPLASSQVWLRGERSATSGLELRMAFPMRGCGHFAHRLRRGITMRVSHDKNASSSSPARSSSSSGSAPRLRPRPRPRLHPHRRTRPSSSFSSASSSSSLSSSSSSSSSSSTYAEVLPATYMCIIHHSQLRSNFGLRCCKARVLLLSAEEFSPMPKQKEKPI